MIRRFIAVFTLVVMILASGVISAPSSGAAIRRAERKLARLINNYRENHNRSRLPLNSRLSRVAEQNSAAMARTGQLRHTSSNPCDGRWGEVVGAGDGVGGAFRNLKASAAHRQIMLRDYWRKMGTGVRKSDQGLTYVTAIFCD